MGFREFCYRIYRIASFVKSLPTIGQASLYAFRPLATPVPDLYDQTTETDEECMRFWVIEFRDMRTLMEEQPTALEEHLLNRESYVEREYQKKLALAIRG